MTATESPEQGSVSVCIAGMHRSGTSMVARLLHLCGLYLGPAGELVGSADSNAEGFWEHKGFLTINERLLSRAGGGWDLPPERERIEEQTSCESEIRRDARELVERFRGHPVWGWKDPRNCLTFSLWKSILPSLRVVVPVRHPADVADSLYRRGGCSAALSLHLWCVYHERLLAETTPSQRLLTHFDSYFVDPETQVERLATFACLATPPSSLRRAARAAIPELRHVDVSRAAAGLPAEVERLYEDLCRESAWPRMTPTDAPVHHSSASVRASEAGGNGFEDGTGRPDVGQAHAWLARARSLGLAAGARQLGDRLTRTSRELLRHPVAAELRRRDRVAAELRLQLDDRIRRDRSAV